MKSEALHDVVASLLAAVGLEGYFEINPLHGGANNRVFRVDVNGSHVCLKEYFQHPNDSRDRFRTEFSFVRFAWNNGVFALPQALACDRQNRLALYEFIQGRHLYPGEVTLDMVQQALDFYCDLNLHKDTPSAEALPMASESCFSIVEHMQLVDYRINRLLALKASSPIDSYAVQFIRNNLVTAWNEIVSWVQREAGRLHLDLEEEVPRSQWCISPSDFGFHNAILTAEEKLRFIDFEYAGWDDPDRLVCDFFCQAAIPVPIEYYDHFAERVAAGLNEPESHVKRMDTLFPVYQIKWCCILLNDFLPTDSKRRQFANESADQDERKEQQLHKARVALKRLTKCDDNIVIKTVAC